MTAIEMVQKEIDELSKFKGWAEAIASGSDDNAIYAAGKVEAYTFSIAKLQGIADYLKLQEAGK